MSNIAIDGLHLAHKNFPNGGTCLEFGVYIGNSYLNTADTIATFYPTSTLIGFDSWQGLPDETEGVWAPDRHRKGEFQATKFIVKEKLRQAGFWKDPRFTFVDGFFSESLTPELQSSIQDLIYVNIDVDIHSSTVEVLDFIYPLLRPGVVIYFDDWKDPQDKFEGKWGEHLAWEEFTLKHPELKYRTVAINEYNQRYIEIE